MDEQGAPKFLRSWMAMWVFTLLGPAAYLLAGFDVGRFYELWSSGWDGLAAIIALGMGFKFGKDTLIKRAEFKANQFTASVSEQ